MKTIAQFAIGYEQLLDAEGRACGDLPPFANDADAMRRMYSMMVLCRLFDTKAINLQRTGRLGTYAPCTGHEATHVAVGAAMRPEDVLCPVYREYGTQIWRGVTLTEILTYWAGDERGTDFAPAPINVNVTGQVYGNDIRLLNDRLGATNNRIKGNKYQ